MAFSFTTDSGTLTIPGAYSTINVQQSNSGLATNGVIFIVGEADAGADFTQEADIGSNAFGSDQMGDVVSKYKSGNCVDAFRGAISAANDPSILGAFSRAIIVKTNVSAKAGSTIAKYDSTTYGTLQDKSFGKLGNLISWQVKASVAEVAPNTGSFAIMLPIASTNISIRSNGGAATPLTLSALETPTAMILAIDGVAGLDTDGGASQGPITAVSGTIALTVVSGTKVSIDVTTPFGGTIPSAGDTMFIPAASALASSHANNAGSYIVTGSSASEILATKLLDVTGTPAQLTAPTTQAALAVASTTNDLQSYGAVTIHQVDAANPIDGFGKSLEIAELTSGTGLLSTLCYTLQAGVPTPVTFISKTATPGLLTSAAEYIASLTDSRLSDSITETLTSGGPIAMQVGYLGTTASLVINATTMTITVVGGAGTSPAVINLKDWKSISDLASYINSLTGFKASPGTAVLGSQSPFTLDEGPFNICGTFGTTPGRIKQDAYKFYTNLQNNAVLVQLAAQAAAGLPAPTATVTFFTGGTKGFTTDAIIQAAFDSLKLARGNFLVPLFSRDAVGDIADNLTEPGSLYTIAATHANALAHVLQMSTLKARRNRQVFLSIRDTYTNDKTVSANLASSRSSVAFQDVKDPGSAGTIVQFQPWMNAIKAASMQAAGFYRAIFNKGIDISGVVQAAGDFNDQDDSKVEDGLNAGLLIIRRTETGGFHYVSDQTTYGKDNNFVFNSIQATYAADVVALTTAQRMEKAFVGQSIADISASLALMTLEAIMADMMRLKLIAPSDDAPQGFKNAKVKISGPTMVVSIEIKLAGAIYFIPINFQVSQVTQSA